MASVIRESETAVTAFARFALFVLVVGVLWIAQGIFIPIAISILVAFILMPVVSRVERVGVPRWLAVLGAVASSAAAIALVGWVVADQAMDFAEKLPQYRGTVREKLTDVAGHANGFLARARRGIGELELQVSDATAALESGAPAHPASIGNPGPPSILAPRADTVTQVPEPSGGPLRQLTMAVRSATAPVLGAGVVVLFAAFILLRRDELRDRIVALAGHEQLHRTTEMMEEAAVQLGRLLLAQLLVGVGFGIVFAGGLLLIGVPNALLFGALVIPLRFVPIVGPWISAALPTALALVVLDGWFPPIATLVLFVVLEVATASIIEPWALGKRTGMSPTAVLLALMFWTWLWGAPGLVLAMPLTTSIAVLGRRVRALEWMATLLNEQTGLPASARLYQRLLAVDIDQAIAVMRSERDSIGLERAYGEVMMPALAALERDRLSGELDGEHAQLAISGMAEIVESLALDSIAVAAPASRTVPRRIALVPAHSEADAVTARMLMHVASSHGHEAQALRTGDLASERAAAATKLEVQVTCICAMPPLAEAHARLMLERMRDRLPGNAVVIALWQREPDARARERLELLGARNVVGSFMDAVRAIES
ncbi:MAG: AI-2E family transporter [Phycisphaerae bacterium]|nr:AI-2E family transporter [Phycisphaerae bacterium]